MTVSGTAFLLERLWWAVAAASLLGLLFGGIGGPGRGSLSSGRASRLGAVGLLAAAAGVAWLGLLPGRPGLWLEAAVLVGAGYAAGTFAASAVRAGLRALRRGPSDPAVTPERTTLPALRGSP